MSKRLIWSGVLLAAALAASAAWLGRSRDPALAFTRLVTRGNGMLEKGDAAGAIGAYSQALRLSPGSSDVRLNLANAYLQAGQPENAERLSREALDLSPGSAAAYYLMGCALLRQNKPGPAAQSLQQSWKIERAVPAVDFQEGMAQQALGQADDAIRDFEGAVRGEPGHPSAHYQLSRLYRQAGRDGDAERELKEHLRILAGRNGTPVTEDELERCAYTRPLAPFVLAQPDPRGIPVHFAEETPAAFAGRAADFRGPLAVLDTDHDGRLSLLVQQKGGGFVLLDNRAGRFSPSGAPSPPPPAATTAPASSATWTTTGLTTWSSSA